MRSSIKYALAAVLMLAGTAAQAHKDTESPTAADTGLEAAPDDRISRIASKFKGSIFLFDQSVTPESIDAGAQQSPIPSYQWWLSFRPRYYFKPNLSLRVRMDLTVEWLNAVDTTYYREGTFGDLWTDLAYNPPTFGGIVSTISLRAVWGTSKQSMGEGQIARVGPSVSFVREFPTRKAGIFELSLAAYGLYHFDMYTSGGTQTSYGCTTTEFDPVVCSQNTGLMNTQGSLTTFVSGKWSPIKQLSISLTYAVLDAWAYKLPNATLPNGAQVEPTNDTRFRQDGWFLASIDYDPKDWLEFSLGYYCLRPILDPNSKYGDPFWEPGGTTRVFFTTTFNLDKLGEAAARRVQKSRAAAEEKKRNLASISF